MPDDSELVERLRHGDEAAFVALVRAYQPSLVQVATAICGNRAVAEEVVQDTWLAVVRGVDRFEGRSSFKTWLFHILANRARTTAGRERRTAPIDLDEGAGRFDASGAWSDPPVPWSDRVDDQVTAERLVPLVRTMVAELPPAQREVLILRDVQGLPAAEVAQVLGLSDGNVRVLLHRARSRVRAGLEATVGTG